MHKFLDNFIVFMNVTRFKTWKILSTKSIIKEFTSKNLTQMFQLYGKHSIDLHQ